MRERSGSSDPVGMISKTSSLSGGLGLAPTVYRHKDEATAAKRRSSHHLLNYLFG